MIALRRRVRTGRQGLGAADAVHDRRQHRAHRVQKACEPVDGPVDHRQHVGADGGERIGKGRLQLAQRQPQIGQLAGEFFGVAAEIGQILDGSGGAGAGKSRLQLLFQLLVGLEHLLKFFPEGFGLRVNNDMRFFFFCHNFLLSGIYGT